MWITYISYQGLDLLNRNYRNISVSNWACHLFLGVHVWPVISQDLRSCMSSKNTIWKRKIPHRQNSSKIYSKKKLCQSQCPEHIWGTTHSTVLVKWCGHSSVHRYRIEILFCKISFIFFRHSITFSWLAIFGHFLCSHEYIGVFDS